MCNIPAVVQSRSYGICRKASLLIILFQGKVSFGVSFGVKVLSVEHSFGHVEHCCTMAEPTSSIRSYYVAFTVVHGAALVTQKLFQGDYVNSMKFGAV